MATTLRQHDRHPFLAFPENKLAVTAIQRLAPLTRRRTVQFVTLVGPSGTGKSRLARELIRSWEAKRSDGKVIYITASEYAASIAEASAMDAIRQFQIRYRKDISLFICEDIQALAGRKETQKQLVAALDEVTDSGGCVLLTSTTMPSGISRLSSRLTNRIRGGLCVDIPLPGADSRKKLLEHYLLSESVGLTPEEITEISQKHEFSPRELLGLLQHLKTSQTTARRQLSNSEVIEQLAVREQYSLTEIASAAAKVFGVKVSELKSASRSQTISTARQVAMYIAREQTDLNYKTVGQFFGRGNHSTVIHACKKIRGLIDSNPVLAHNVELVEKRLQNG